MSLLYKNNRRALYLPLYRIQIHKKNNRAQRLYKPFMRLLFCSENYDTLPKIPNAINAIGIEKLAAECAVAFGVGVYVQLMSRQLLAHLLQKRDFMLKPRSTLLMARMLRKTKLHNEINKIHW